eukprot:CAMPEP_0174233410 /NCGR_PEP_ID=MMETSP0417-20130205/3455_1 /TAXON_ID=242541 /ORGANISM="Mayorella sp, Strain BSH-02190019" /LENGTH=1677 /DNA_ID=CAMNT_0015311617 /DNA_START=35 /DNA_END=5068 /DNA_ORIENTATION=+
MTDVGVTEAEEAVQFSWLAVQKNAFEDLRRRIQTGQRTMRQRRSFWKQLIELEREHARSLLSLCQQHCPQLHPEPSSSSSASSGDSTTLHLKGTTQAATQAAQAAAETIFHTLQSFSSSSSSSSSSSHGSSSSSLTPGSSSSSSFTHSTSSVSASEDSDASDGDARILLESWAQTCLALQRSASERLKLVVELQAQVQAPIEQHLTRVQERGKVFSDGESLVARSEECERKLSRVRDHYYRLSRDLQVMEHKTLPSLSGNKRALMEQQAGALKVQVQQAEKRYREETEEARCFQQQHYTEHMPRLLDSLQHIEEARVRVSQLTLANFAHVYASDASSMRSVCTAVNEAASRIRVSDAIRDMFERSRLACRGEQIAMANYVSYQDHLLMKRKEAQAKAQALSPRGRRPRSVSERVVSSASTRRPASSFSKNSPPSSSSKSSSSSSSASSSSSKSSSSASSSSLPDATHKADSRRSSAQRSTVVTILAPGDGEVVAIDADLASAFSASRKKTSSSADASSAPSSPSAAASAASAPRAGDRAYTPPPASPTASGAQHANSTDRPATRGTRADSTPVPFSPSRVHVHRSAEQIAAADAIFGSMSMLPNSSTPTAAARTRPPQSFLFPEVDSSGTVDASSNTTAASSSTTNAATSLTTESGSPARTLTSHHAQASVVASEEQAPGSALDEFLAETAAGTVSAVGGVTAGTQASGATATEDSEQAATALVSDEAASESGAEPRSDSVAPTTEVTEKTDSTPPSSIVEASSSEAEEPSLQESSTLDGEEPTLDDVSPATAGEDPTLDGVATATGDEPTLEDVSTVTEEEPTLDATAKKPALDDASPATEETKSSLGDASPATEQTKSSLVASGENSTLGVDASTTTGEESTLDDTAEEPPALDDASPATSEEPAAAVHRPSTNEPSPSRMQDRATSAATRDLLFGSSASASPHSSAFDHILGGVGEDDYEDDEDDGLFGASSTTGRSKSAAAAATTTTSSKDLSLFSSEPSDLADLHDDTDDFFGQLASSSPRKPRSPLPHNASTPTRSVEASRDLSRSASPGVSTSRDWAATASSSEPADATTSVLETASSGDAASSGLSGVGSSAAVVSTESATATEEDSERLSLVGESHSENPIESHSENPIESHSVTDTESVVGESDSVVTQQEHSSTELHPANSPAAQVTSPVQPQEEEEDSSSHATGAHGAQEGQENQEDTSLPLGADPSLAVFQQHGPTHCRPASSTSFVGSSSSSSSSWSSSSRSASPPSLWPERQPDTSPTAQPTPALLSSKRPECISTDTTTTATHSTFDNDERTTGLHDPALPVEQPAIDPTPSAPTASAKSKSDRDRAFVERLRLLRHPNSRSGGALPSSQNAKSSSPVSSATGTAAVAPKKVVAAAPAQSGAFLDFLSEMTSEDPASSSLFLADATVPGSDSSSAAENGGVHDSSSSSLLNIFDTPSSKAGAAVVQVKQQKSPRPSAGADLFASQDSSTSSTHSTSSFSFSVGGGSMNSIFGGSSVLSTSDSSGGGGGALVRLSPLDRGRFESELEQKSARNNYYKLFSITKDDNVNVLLKRRKELHVEYGPDAYSHDPVAGYEASLTLKRLDNIFTTVLRNLRTRRLYDRLVTYRERAFSLLDELSADNLRSARDNLRALKASILTEKMPSELVEEVDLWLSLISHRLCD